MATSAKRSGNSGIFWMNDVSEGEQPLVFVPGVDGGLKSQTPLRCVSSKKGTTIRVKHASNGKNPASYKTMQSKQGHSQSEYSGSYTTEEMSVHQRDAAPTMHALSQRSDAFASVPQVSSKAKSDISLKDLCVEDKRRIANLIEELARVSEEKEESVQRLKDEQGTFERKIQELEEQNLMIAQERESLQQQYKECQELLGLYQQYLSQQQAKLNQSMAQLHQPTHNKVPGSEEAPSRTSTSRVNGSLFDCSYLGLAAAGAQPAQVFRSGNARRGAVETCRNPASLSCDSEWSPNDGATKQHMRQRRDGRQPRICCTCERCQDGCHDTGYGTQHWRSESSSCLVNCHHATFTRKEHQSLQNGNVITAEAREALARPLLGHEDWEEKRHQLLLQKMQLETEREKLQARLAEQEERLSRQTEQLRQSRLHHSSQAQFSSSNTQNEGSEPEGPSHQDLPSRSSEDVETHSAAQDLHLKTSQAKPAPSATGNANPLQLSQRDMATSPIKAPSGQTFPTPVSVMQNPPETRLDYSLAEVLDIFSPVSAPKQYKPAARRPRMSRHSSIVTGSKSAEINLLTPGGSSLQSIQQDLEESQILEDIFFIC